MSTPAPGFTEWGLAVGSVTAVRSFRIDGLGRLTGLSHRSVWLPGVNEAECQARRGFAVWGSIYTAIGDDPEDVSPVEQAHDLSTCTCGFYAYYDEHDDGDRMSGDVQAIVDLHGKAVMGSRGLRAEKGRIVALVRPKAAEPVRASRVVRWADDQGEARVHRFAQALYVVFAGVGILGALLGVLAVMVAGLAAAGASLAAAILLTKAAHRYDVRRLYRATFSDRNNDHLFPTTAEMYGVPVYDSIEAAVKAHPLTPPPPAPPAPTPQTDPDFWTRPVR